MQIDLILETMRGVPSGGFVLVLFMSISCALLVSYIMDTGFFTTVFAVPAYVFAGLLGYSVFAVGGVVLTPDKASNIAISAGVGFIMFTALALIVVRLWYQLQDVG